MPESAVLPSSLQRRFMSPIVSFVAAMTLFGIILFLANLSLRVPTAQWLRAIFFPDRTVLSEALVHYSFLPRAVAAWLAGATLALSGAIFQQILRNPLAEPTTLGVSAGAQVALAVAALMFPAFAGLHREAVAFVGAGAASSIVFTIAAFRAFSSQALILAGLIVSMYLGALSAIATLFFRDALSSLFLWSAGSLDQSGWAAVQYLLPRTAVCAAAVSLMVRPLSAFDLDDDGVRNLGLSLTTVRAAGLIVALALSTFVVSAIGLIGFIGLIAPTLAKLLGARRFSQRLLWAPLLGGALLLLTDQLVQTLSQGWHITIPTGIVTALGGSGLLLWMLRQLKAGAKGVSPMTSDDASRLRPPSWFIGCGAALLIASIICVLHLGRSTDGWTWSDGETYLRLWGWRAPRVFAAMSAGAMLAMAGSLMQRLTANPMASPEILGVSAGASLGPIILTLFVPAPGYWATIVAAGLSAAMTLSLMLSLARRHAYAPEKMLLTGIAVGAAFSAIVAMLLVRNDPRLTMLLAWMAGSTYRVDGMQASIAIGVLVVLASLLPLMRRWLAIFPLGEDNASALGVDIARGRLCILLEAAFLTGAATLVVGPLSFVGLMGPHLARLAGFRRPLDHLFGAAVAGALIMVVADWLGRSLAFPYQIPAGLLATFIGGPYFIFLMARSRA